MNNKPLIRSLHPLTALIYTATLFILAMTWNNPLWLIILLGAVSASLFAASAWRSWRKLLLLSISLSIIFGLVNAFLSRSGATIIWRGPDLPLIGRPSVSLEALLFGLNAGLKITLAVSIFCLYQEIMDQDESLSLFTRFAPKSALTIILTSLLIPRMRRELSRIRDVMSLRGAGFDAGSTLARIRASRPLLQVLLISSLEGAWDIATALNCRAFGSGKRSVYRKNIWLPRDWLVTGGAATAMVVFAAGLCSRRGLYNFYPTLDPLVKNGDIPFLIALALSLSVASLLNWSWKRWPFLKSRI